MNRFQDAEIAAVYRAIYERRDMRHFRPDPVDEAQLARLLDAAHHAPSVGFMQPWRFIRIQDPALRRAIHALTEAEQQRTADACGERAEQVRQLKLAELVFDDRWGRAAGQTDSEAGNQTTPAP